MATVDGQGVSPRKPQQRAAKARRLDTGDICKKRSLVQKEVIMVQSEHVSGVKLPSNVVNERHVCSGSLGQEEGMQGTGGM